MQKLVKGMTFNNMTVMIPWLSALIADNRKVLGGDWWSYGVERHRAALDAFLRYHYEQGLSTRHWTLEEIFVPYLLED